MAWTKRDATVMFQRMIEERHQEMGRTITRLRKAQGWTQPELAHEAHVSVGTISRLENGKHEGRMQTVRAVAQALGVETQDLLPASEPDEAELDQLDRIERKLDRIMEYLDSLSDPGALMERELVGTDHISPARTSDSAPAARARERASR